MKPKKQPEQKKPPANKEPNLQTEETCDDNNKLAPLLTISNHARMTEELIVQAKDEKLARHEARVAKEIRKEKRDRLKKKKKIQKRSCAKCYPKMEKPASQNKANV